MQLYFKSRALFNANAAEVTSDTVVIRAPESGRPLRYGVRIKVHGYIEGTSQSDLTTRETALRLALIDNYGDLSLKQDSGAASGLTIGNTASITGVVIDRGPVFNEAQGAEYVNRRTVDFEGYAEYLIPNSQAAILSWRETFTYVGNCDPVTNWRPMVNAAPIQQEVYPSSTMKVIQQGRAVGHTVRPTAPPPRWPFPIEQSNRRQIIPDSGRRIGPAAGAIVEPGITWHYEYESPTPLIALPGLPPF